MGDIQKEQFDKKLASSTKILRKCKHVLKIFNFPLVSVKQSKYEKIILLFQTIPIYKVIDFEGFTDE